MVTLDFQISPTWQDSTEAKTVESAGCMALHYQHFLGDVFFRADGADYSATWGWVPVLDFALGLLRLVRCLGPSDSGRFEFTESNASLTFQRSAQQVKISASYSASVAVVSCAELRSGVELFARRVVSDLVSMYPVLECNEAFQAFVREVIETRAS